jgi:putative transposase
LERKIEEIHGKHIPHNTIYKVLLNHGLVEENIKKESRGSGFVMKENAP